MSNFYSSRYLHGARSTKAIYGIILIMAALIGFQLYVTKPSTLAFKVFFAGLVIVAAEAYSELLGEKIRHKRNLTAQERRVIIGDSMVIASVAFYPTAIFALSATNLYSVDTAFKLCYLLGIVCLGLFGYAASQAAGSTRWRSLRQAIVTASIGSLVILIKYKFSH